MKIFIHWMYENNLFIKDGIIYDTAYGCSNKCRRENAIWLLSVLKFTYRVIIYIFINNLSHRRSKIDGINGSDKTHLKTYVHDRHCRI